MILLTSVRFFFLTLCSNVVVLVSKLSFDSDSVPVSCSGFFPKKRKSISCRFFSALILLVVLVHVRL